MLLGLRDEGRLYFEGIEDTFVEELALELDEDAENVKVTMAYMLRMGMLQEVSESELFLTRLPECVGKETSKAELMRKKRAREKAEVLEGGNNVTEALPPVTKCYTEKEIEKDKEEDIEKREKRIEVDYQLIADMYNSICSSYPKIRALSDARKKAIKARFNSGYSKEDFKDLFTYAESSDFLKGKNDRNWQATFDWLIKDANMAKVLDGNYQNKQGKSVGANGIAIEHKTSDLDDIF
jgi:hypothetical protein